MAVTKVHTADSHSPLPEIVLSEYARENNIEVRDIEQYVRRGTARRIQEKEAKGEDGGRPQNAFVLYRTVYQHVVGLATNEVKQNKISSIVGLSWKKLETSLIKQRFKEMAEIEKQEHAKAFGTKKYSPKKKPGDGRKSLAERKTSHSKRAKATRAADMHQHLRAPVRSPEPSYYQIEGTPSGEVPSLSSYQGTPMTSSVPTPQPGFAQPFYTQPFEAAFDQESCFSHLPYGQGQLNGQVVWNPITQEPMFQAGPLPTTTSMYPDLPEPMTAAPPQASYEFVNPGSYQHFAVQIPHGVSHMPLMGSVQQPQPVLRQIVPDTGGAIDPQTLAMPMLDPGLAGDAIQDLPDHLTQALTETQACAPQGAMEDEFNYLNYDDWAEDTFA
ncbi:hypothetical protein NLU13_9020 [Sarocladium strictum]|uniref:HMG box domain-containing protein n=1 Tax=Sarocladium strictum TaxID=5046 RepID=A0AA39G9D1_SARSR|nr:hypothetical protein NLU13_9020 [Sarocladium strictum]